MADMPAIEQMAPATGSQGAPSSGVYGEKADLAALEASLPPMEQPTGLPAPRPVPELPPGLAAPQPSGLPQGIFAPSRRPEEPPGMPMSMPPQMATTTPEQRIQLLHSISQNPNVSEEFRQFAATLLGES